MDDPPAKRRARASPEKGLTSPDMMSEPAVQRLEDTRKVSDSLKVDAESETAMPLTPLHPDQITTESLKKLQSTNERRLLDVVDKLRRIGLNGTIELPQLVVCGDQSSGKSSVLEAITEIPFPRKAGLCTRFATEIVLRRQPTSSVTIKINASKSRSAKERKKLSTFTWTVIDLSELPLVVEDATAAMGLGKIGQSAAFSRDILSVEICGPDRPQLTLVDLPGLIHSATKASTEADKDLIFGLVQEYMQNPRTIILAVVSAKNDAANQIILSLFKKMDPKGSRTLGIITKPDCLSAGDEQSWLDLAMNKEVFLQRGWHVVKNRSEGEMQYTFAQRNTAEDTFFAQGRFKDLPRHNVGIETLRDRLSDLLHRHLVQELPALKQELKITLRETTEQLDGLGDRRETPHEQKMLLTTISQKVNIILRDAINGSYVDPFFDDVELDEPTTVGRNVRRFRALVQDLNSRFAENMRLRGHKYMTPRSQINKEPAPPSSPVSEDDSDDSDNSDDSDEEDEEDNREVEAEAVSIKHYDDELPEPEALTDKEYLDWVKKVMLRCRGRELPGSVNPEVTSHLFWEQSKPWKALAEDHVEQVRSMVKYFTQQVLEHVAPVEFKKPLEELVVNVVLDDTLKDGQEELRKLLQDKARHPSTYNHYYTDIVQKRRQQKYEAFVKDAQKAATSSEGRWDHGRFKTEMNKSVTLDMEVFSAEETLESAKAYYKDEMKYFIHAVTKQVIERCMIEPLTSRILSPTGVQGMTDEEVSFIAAEPPEVMAHRAFLEERKQMLEKGEEIFREAMGGVKRSRIRAFGV